LIVVHIFFLADDEKVRIWDVERKKLYQTICDELERWGQITCIQWLHGFSENSLTICFGTGRGLFLIYQQAKDAVSFLCNAIVPVLIFFSGYLQTIIQHSYPPV
jgi:hypothetical protein